MGFDGAVIGITAERKAAEQARMVSDLGGVPIVGATMHTIPLADDADLAAALRAVTVAPPQFMVFVTGIGTRGLFRGAAELGLDADVRRVVGAARRLARGPKARAALRELGFDVEWTPPSETSSELLEHLVPLAVPGDHVAVQIHGDPMPSFAARLEPLGVRVTEIPVYRWVAPADPAPGLGLVEAICAGEVDAVTFTSAPSVRGLFALAGESGRIDALARALDGRVIASVGEVTAEPLEDRHVRIDYMPEHPRMGFLYRGLAERWDSLRPPRQ